MEKLQQVLSLFWHGVESDAVAPEYRDDTTSTVSGFREQIRFLTSRYTPISVSNFLDVVVGSRHVLESFAKPPVLLGFDDGFRSVITRALPVLHEFGAPAVCFVIGETFRGSEFVPWFVEVKQLVRRARAEKIVYDGLRMDLARAEHRARLRRLVGISFRRCTSEEERQNLLTRLAEMLRLPRPKASQLDEDLQFASEAELCDARVGSLLAVGSHAMSHRGLGDLTVGEQDRELEESDAVLRRCAAYVPVVAYPDGSFDSHTIVSARRIYQAGFAVTKGSSYGNLFAYPRIAVNGDGVRELEYSISFIRRRLILPVRRIWQGW
jgi:peptidoglycan/xylan/chitin deacetylase (PgdA/CDA1 family)